MSVTAPASGPAGSRRFWGTVLCFALANAAIWLGYDRLVQHRRHTLLEVRQSAPAGNSQISGRPILWWTFNLDVAAPGTNDPPPGVVSPQVPGKWKWDDARTLTFTPDKPLPKATAMTVTLRPERLRTPDGFSLAKPYVTVVHTAPLQVLAIRQAAFDGRDCLVLEFEFDDDVLPAEVLQHLSLTSAEGKPVTFHPHGNATGHVVRVMTDPMPTTTADHLESYVNVKLSAGLTGRGGPLGLAGPYVQRLPVGWDLLATEASADFEDHDAIVLTVRFNNSIDAQLIKTLLSVEPALPFTLTGESNEVELHGAFQPATRYAIKIAKAPAGVPRIKCPRPDTLSVFVPDRQPSVWFDRDEGYLGSAGNRTLMAHAVNVTDVRATITRVYDNNLVAWRNSREASRWGAGGYGRPVAAKSFHLLLLKNKTQDVRLSLDDLLPADAPRDGVYLVNLDILSAAEADDGEQTNSRFNRRYSRYDDSAMVTLSDIGLTAKQGRTAVTVWATSLRTAEPLEHVRVRLYSNKNQTLGEAMTDDKGLASISLAPPAPGEGPSLLLADRPTASLNATPATGGASIDRDLTWLDLRNSRISFGQTDTAGAAYFRTGHEAFLYSDRGVYRPGETVHLRAIVRGIDGAIPPSFPVQWQFRRPDLHDWKTVLGQIDTDGAVSLDLSLPADLPTGRWSVLLGLPGHLTDVKSFGSASFQVEDFMPNRMQVRLNLEGHEVKPTDGDHALPRFLIVEEPISARVRADYLFGRPVADRPARLVARLDPAVFAPPQWRDWSFGDSASAAQTLEGLKLVGHRAELPEEILDAHGEASFDLDLPSLLQDGTDIPSHVDRSQAASRLRRARNHRTRVIAASVAPATQPTGKYVGPWRLTVTASVIETGGRAVSASRQADLDPAPWYIGVHTPPAGVAPGTPCSVDVALVSPAGDIAPLSANLEAVLYRELWNSSLTYEGGRYVYHSTRVLEPVQKPMAVKVSGGRGRCVFCPPDPGAYVLLVRDPVGGCVTSIGFYVGGRAWEDNISREDPERLELLVQRPPATDALVQSLARADLPGILSATRTMLTAQAGGSNVNFLPGQTARVIVRSPFAGRLLLSVETDDVVNTRVIDMAASHVAVPIDLTDACRPNAYVTATVIRPINPDGQWRTHRAIGTLRIPLDNSDRKLDVQIESAKAVRPANSLAVRVRITDASGAPVENAAVTVAAVDEGICQLTGFTTPDPFAFFIRKRALGVFTADLYSQLMPEVPKPDKTSPIGGDDGGYDPRHLTPVSARRVKPVALISAVLHTDANGDVQANFNVPQFTGKLRVMAVASSDRSFGSGDGAVLVRSPLLVQSSWPRFAAPADKFLVPLVAFNNTPLPADATITMRITDGPLRLGPKSQRELTMPSLKLPGNGQSTQLVEVSAGEQCGVSHAVLIANMGGQTYEEETELPVRPASPEVTLGGYATATPKAGAEISLPGGMLDGTARFQLKVTPWPSLQLPQGLEYLERYPYGCLEQTTSTLFPLVYLSDIGGLIAPGVFEKERVASKVQAGITRLIGMQTADGGLAMWPAYREPWPWGSVYACHFLIEARNAGHAVPEEFGDQLLAYLRTLLRQSSDDPEMLETQAYACYVLALAGKPERGVMSRLTEVVNTSRPDGVAPPAQARFHLAAAWLAAGRRDLAEGLIPHALPLPRDKQSLAGTLGSPTRDRAILVDTLLAVQPDHPTLPQLVQQLADAGRHGEWRSTQDTAFAVLALGRYLRQNRAATPYATADLLLDGVHLVDASDGQPLLWEAGDMDHRLPGDGSKLRVRITGAAGATAHLAWLETGVPLKPPPPADHGMKVRQRLLDERGKPLDAIGVHSGDLVQVELTIASQTPLEHVVIDDLLPAGLEIENPRLTTTAPDSAEQPEDRQPNVFQDARLEMRDDRLVLIGGLPNAGAGTYVYTARAVTAGTFVLPPVRAECMYDNAINSISGGGTFVVIPAGSPRIANVQE